MALTQITITDRVKWHEKCEWIEHHCDWYQDATNWGLWQIGQDDIVFFVDGQSATLFYLQWGS